MTKPQTTPRQKFSQHCSMCGHEHMLHARCKRRPDEPKDISSGKFKRLMNKYVVGFDD